MRKRFNFYCTLRDWEFGVGVALPAVSQRWMFGSKMVHGWRFYLYLGPFTLELGQESIEVLQPELTEGEISEHPA